MRHLSSAHYDLAAAAAAAGSRHHSRWSQTAVSNSIRPKVIDLTDPWSKSDEQYLLVYYKSGE